MLFLTSTLARLAAVTRSHQGEKDGVSLEEALQRMLCAGAVVLGRWWCRVGYVTWALGTMPWQRDTPAAKTAPRRVPLAARNLSLTTTVIDRPFICTVSAQLSRSSL